MEEVLFCGGGPAVYKPTGRGLMVARRRSTAAVLVVKGCMVLIMLPKKTFPGGKKVTE
jgi:hypothetical protein